MAKAFSRRAVLLGLSATATLGAAPVRHAFAALDDKPFYFLTFEEARSLALLCDTLIPKDEHPSASEAGVVDFIDIQMAGPYGKGEGLYLEPPFFEGSPEQGYQLPLVPADLIRTGLAAFQRAEPTFAQADAAGREAIMTRLSEGEMDFGDLPASAFFDELWKLTNQGYFADPIHGGNKGYAGWEMVGFPGAHAYYLSFVDKHNVRYPQPPMGINHEPGGDGNLPAPKEAEEP